MVSNISGETTPTDYVAEFTIPDTNKTTWVVVTPEFIEENFNSVPPLNPSKLKALPASKKFEVLIKKHDTAKDFAHVYMTEKTGQDWGFMKGKRPATKNGPIRTEATDHLLIGDTEIPVTDFKLGMQTKFENPAIVDIAALPRGPLSLCYKLSILPKAVPTSCSSLISTFQNAHILIPWHMFPKKYLSFRGTEDADFQNKTVQEQLMLFTESQEPDSVYTIEQDPQGNFIFRDLQGVYQSTIKIADGLDVTPKQAFAMAIRALTSRDPEIRPGMKAVETTPQIFQEVLSTYEPLASPSSLVLSACHLHNIPSRPDWYKDEHPTNETLKELFYEHFTQATKWVSMFSTESLISSLNLMGFARMDPEPPELFHHLYQFLLHCEWISLELLKEEEKSLPEIEQQFLNLRIALEMFLQNLQSLETTETQPSCLSKGQKKRARKKKQKEENLTPPVSALDYCHRIASFFEQSLNQKRDTTVEIFKQLSKRRLCDIFDHEVSDQEMEEEIPYCLGLKIQLFERVMWQMAESMTEGKDDLIDAQNILSSIKLALYNQQYATAWKQAQNLRQCSFVKTMHEFIQQNNDDPDRLFHPIHYHNVRLVVQLLDFTNVLADLIGKKARIEIL